MSNNNIKLYIGQCRNGPVNKVNVGPDLPFPGHHHHLRRSFNIPHFTIRLKINQISQHLARSSAEDQYF